MPTEPGQAADAPRWRKSVHSGAQGNCVELAAAPASDVLVRNSRFPDGPVLRLHAGELADFLSAIKAGELDELVDPAR